MSHPDVPVYADNRSTHKRKLHSFKRLDLNIIPHSPRTRLCVLEVLSMNAEGTGLLWTSSAGEDAAPGDKAEVRNGRFPLCCHFSARKCSTLASRSRQSRRLSFSASWRCLCARSLAITWERGMPNAWGATSAAEFKRTVINFISSKFISWFKILHQGSVFIIDMHVLQRKMFYNTFQEGCKAHLFYQSNTVFVNSDSANIVLKTLSTLYRPFTTVSAIFWLTLNALKHYFLLTCLHSAWDKSQNILLIFVSYGLY